jgi:hypothetical protein
MLPTGPSLVLRHTLLYPLPPAPVPAPTVHRGIH